MTSSRHRRYKPCDAAVTKRGYGRWVFPLAINAHSYVTAFRLHVFSRSPKNSGSRCQISFSTIGLLAAWAFKYDQRMLGINIHADPAVINVNFWITPDEANLDPSNGGLVVWDTAAPEDWSYPDYNINVARMKRFIASSGAKAKRFAHRQNLAVIFNSSLSHKTDTLNFKSGYENR